MKKACIAFSFLVLICVSLAAQAHVSVPVDSHIYYILEQAELKGLINTLPAVRPYSQRFIVESIEKILKTPTNRLSSNERAILEKELEKYRPQRETGRIDWTRGSYTYNTQQNTTRLSLEVGVGLQMAFSGAYYDDDTGTVWGMEHLPHVYLKGDVGEHLS